MDKIGVGIIGCGARAMAVLRLTVKQDDRIRVVGLCDPEPQSIEAARAEFGGGVPVYEDYRALVQAEDVDWVIIGSWNCFHAEQTIAAFEAGKHVFCEKPLAITLDECLAMKAAWEKSGRMFNIGFTLRYSPHYRRIKEVLASGTLGHIVSMEFNETLDFNHGGYIMGDWRRLQKSAGSHLLEKCCHDVDLANWIIDARATRVASFGGLDFFTPENAHHIERIGKDANGREAYRTWPGLHLENPFTAEKDIVDNQVAIIEYANGARATFHTNANSIIPERRMYILGTEGTLRADVLTGEMECQRIGFDTVREKEETGGKGGHGGGDELLGKELAATMIEGTLPSVGLVEGLESAITVFAIDEAMGTGTVVDLAPYWTRVDAG